jgi:thioredoxin reductase (NADPH)
LRPETCASDSPERFPGVYPRKIIPESLGRKATGRHWLALLLLRPGQYLRYPENEEAMADTITSPVLIIGAGPAGYTAAIYAARAALKPVLVAGLQPGGQLTITTDVENYPGFADVIQGPWLMEQMRKQAEHVGTRVIEDIVTAIDLSGRPFRATGDSGTRYLADSVVIATGAQARWLGIPSERKLQGFGVSACATCDGFFFRGKRVAVIGGGNSAVEEALYLTHHAAEVTLVHRRDSLRAEKILQQRLFANPKITVVWDHVVDEILGTEDPPGVTGLRLRHARTGLAQELALDGVFVAIGHTPTTALFRGQLEMDAEGYIVTAPDSTRTSVPGVFAAGDVQDKVFRQAVTAAGTGCMAALEAEKFLAAAPAQPALAAD